jgi:hypothetical protein
VAALPAATIPPAPGLRFVKTSEADTGTWVTEEKKFSRFIAKRSPFIDVTKTFDLNQSTPPPPELDRAVLSPRHRHTSRRQWRYCRSSLWRILGRG